MPRDGMSDAPAVTTHTPARNARWVKGQSGNPLGGKIVQRDVRDLARLHTTEAVLALVALLHKDRYATGAAQTLLAYGYGRPVQNVAVRVIRDVSDLSDAELRALAGLADPGAAVPAPITIEAEADPADG